MYSVQYLVRVNNAVQIWGYAHAYAKKRYPIVISADSYPMVRIMLYAPDFSPYAADTIGKYDSTVTISTRGTSIQYNHA